jgi:hypothetical protein
LDRERIRDIPEDTPLVRRARERGREDPHGVRDSAMFRVA